MTRKDLVLELTKSGLTHEQASAAIEAILHAIRPAITDGKIAKLTGFGTFSVATRPSRLETNPSEEIIVSARKASLL